VARRLHIIIFVGMALGVVFGLLLWERSGLWTSDGALAVRGRILWVFDLVGTTIFVGVLKMLVAPLIFASIVAGVTSLPNIRELGSVGWKTFAYYLTTTAIAVVIGLLLVLTIRPGHWSASQRISDHRRAELVERYGEAAVAEAAPRVQDIDIRRQEAERYSGAALSDERLAKIEEAVERTPGVILRNTIGDLLTNPFTSLTTNNSLGIIFFAILLGVGCIAVGGPAKPVVAFFHGACAVILRITVWLMNISPLAIMCLMAALVARHGPEVFQTLGGYVITVIGGIAIHVVVLLTICRVIGGRGPVEFLSGLKEAWLVAFSTRSSAATLPVTLECVTDHLGVDPRAADFVLPVGATVNMDGTALYEGVAVIFLIQIYGTMPDVAIHLGPVETFLIFITAVLASVGAAAVPDAGLVTMVLVANAVGLPVYYLPLIFSVDAFLDMFRTSTNVMGDAVGAVVVDRLERSRFAAAPATAAAG
jgi:Na+/H+-dicarboxylate symporter